MMVIAHNLLAMNSSRMLGINGKAKAKNTEKLSSGYRINRSADDAAGLAISEKMRRQIRGLHQGAENIQDGVSLANVADGALNEIHDILQRQRELLIKAANGTNTEEDKSYIQQEISQLSQEFDRIFDDTTFNEKYIFKGKDTLLDGPNNETKITDLPPSVDTNTSSKDRVVWIKKGDTPSDSSDTVTTTKTYDSNSYFWTETPKDTDGLGHIAYDEEYVDRSTHTEVVTDVKTDITYQKITGAEYDNEATLRPLQGYVGNSGYMGGLSNKSGTLPLSCAMSQLGAKVDGQLLSIDLYSRSTLGTTYPDAYHTVTKYNLGQGLILTQSAAVENNDTYKISYSVENTGTQDHDVDIRFAFDTLNVPVTAINDGSTSFTLESELAKISISGQATGGNLDRAMLGKIDDFYNDWNASSLVHGQDSGIHSGVGYYFSGNATAGSTLSLGTVSYGPIELKADPWRETTAMETKETTYVTNTDDITTMTILPEYIDIATGADAENLIPIRLWNLSASTLGVEAGHNITTDDPDSSLENIDRAFEKINSIRSYYGAITNRLEHAYNINLNTEENTQYAESAIRDADMAKESMEFAKNNILAQAGQSMLAQANQSNQGVLTMLG